MSETAQEIRYKDLLNKTYEEIWTHRNFSFIDEVIAENIKVQETGMEFNSIEDFKNNIKIFFNAFQQTKITVTNQLVKENVVVTRFDFEGMHTGKFVDIPPTNKKIKFSGIEVARFVNDKISEIWAEFDQLQVMRQLGMELKPMELAH